MDNRPPNPADSVTAFNPGENEMPRTKNIIYEVWAEPNKFGSGFVGCYQAPGITAGLIRDPETREVKIFGTEDAAKLAAAQRLFDIVNSPRQGSVRHLGKDVRYRKLTGPEFAELLRDSGITLTLFCYLYGTSIKRATHWLDGRNEKGDEELAPHPVRVFLELLVANKSNIDIAEQITAAVVTSRSPAR